MTQAIANAQVEKFIDDMFRGSDLNVGGTQTQQVSKHFIVAASGSVVWTPSKACWLRKISSDTAQWALTTNGLTYTQLLALGAPVQFFAGVISYSNAAIQDNMNVFIPPGTKLTFSVSNAGVQRAVLYFDEALT